MKIEILAIYRDGSSNLVILRSGKSFPEFGVKSLSFFYRWCLWLQIHPITKPKLMSYCFSSILFHIFLFPLNDIHTVSVTCTYTQHLSVYGYIYVHTRHCFTKVGVIFYAVDCIMILSLKNALWRSFGGIWHKSNSFFLLMS